MKIISNVNTKGGVGKTVTSVHLGASLAQVGHSVLLVDIDLQAGLTGYFDVDTQGVPTTADVLSGGAGIDEAAQQVRPNLFLVPATDQMEAAEFELAKGNGGEVRLRSAFRRFVKGGGHFDFVLIDCPSGWAAVTKNALLASDYFLVPVNSEPAAITNAVRTVASARELAQFHEQELELLGVLLTRYRRTNAALAIEAQAKSLWPDDLFATRIRQAEKVNELGILLQTTSDLSASASGPVGADYQALAQEFIQRAK